MSEPVPSLSAEVQTARSVTQIVTAHRQTECEGFPIRRPFPTTGLADVDPFLMLDEVGPVDWAPGTAKGGARPPPPWLRDHQLHSLR